jgi:hypothetical protein
MTTATVATIPTPAPAGRPDALVREARDLGLRWGRAEGGRRRCPGSPLTAWVADRSCDQFQAAILRLVVAGRAGEAKAILMVARRLADRDGGRGH